MPVYLVNYDLHSPGQNYDLLIDRIKSYECCPVLASTWAIATSDTPKQIIDFLSMPLDANDEIMVTRWTNDSYWHLGTHANNWIMERGKL